ncbi:MAG: acetylxylan esterase [Fimbriimonadaceae bacterium]|nr:acetylxylan esterase [Fimbriimonadaceae bacterium]
MSLFDPYVPEDFDAFWREACDEAARAPLDFHRSIQDEQVLPRHLVERLTFRGPGGEKLHGWFAYPEDARREPAFLWIPPYGRESLLPNAYGTREGMASLSFNLHGLDAFYQEKYVPSRGYFAEGALEPETWVFRTLAQRCLVALRVLQAQIEADEDRIGCMGMSQGAGLSIWMGALSPIVRAVCADMPFLCAMRETLSNDLYRYPLKELQDLYEGIPLGRERVLNTIAYYDTVNFATRCRKPTHVSLGLKDPSARPAHVRAAYEALGGERTLVEYDFGHDWHPGMVDANRRWLLSHLSF